MRLTDTISIRLIKRIEIEPDEIVSSYVILSHLILSYLIRFLQLVVLSISPNKPVATILIASAAAAVIKKDNTERKREKIREMAMESLKGPIMKQKDKYNTTEDNHRMKRQHYQSIHCNS